MFALLNRNIYCLVTFISLSGDMQNIVSRLILTEIINSRNDLISQSFPTSESVYCTANTAYHCKK